MTRTLYADAHVTVTIDDTEGLVRYARTREPYGALETFREQNDRLLEAMSSLPTGTLQLLIDTRQAPPRNDDAFEAELLRVLGAVVPRFRTYASLVKTAVGRLQVTRVAKARGGDPVVFAEERDALAYLQKHRASGASSR